MPKGLKKEGGREERLHRALPNRARDVPRSLARCQCDHGRSKAVSQRKEGRGSRVDPAPDLCDSPSAATPADVPKKACCSDLALQCVLWESGEEFWLRGDDAGLVGNP